MADFDAGSIEANLDVDRSPFTRGIELAQEQAHEFEDDGIVIPVSVDDGDALVAFDDIEMRADELDGRDIDMQVHVDTAEADAKLDETRARVDGGDGRGGLVGAFATLSGGGSGALRGLLLGGGLTTALGALPALLGAATGAAVGLGGALTVAIGGLAPFALVAKSDFTDMQGSLKDLTKQQQALNDATTDPQRQAALKAIATDTAALQGPAGLAAKAYGDLQANLAQLKTATAPAVFGVMSDFFKLASNVLPQLTPLIGATGEALSGVASQLNTAFSGPGFTAFIHFLSADIGPVLGSLASSFTSFGGGFAAAIEKSQPLIDLVLKSINGFATAFEAVANAPGFNAFINEIVTLMPQVGDVLSTVGNAIVQIFTALAPSIGPALNILTMLGDEIAQLAPILGPLVSAFVSLIGQALVPILPILTTLVQSLVPPLVSLFNYLAPLLPPIAQAFADIVEAILPLVPVFGELVATLLPPLVQFIETLVKQGLAPLILQLAQSLGPVLPQIAASFTRILTALTPLIPQLVQGLLPVIVKLAPQLPGLANSLATLAVAFLNILTAVPPSFWTQLFMAMEPLANPTFTHAIEDVAGALTAVLNAGAELAKWILGAQADIHNFFANLGPNIVKAVSGAATWLLSTGSDIILGLWNGIYGFWTGTLLPWFKGLGTWVENAVPQAITWLAQTGVDIVHGIWNGIDSAGSWLYNKIVGFVKDHIKDAVTNPLGIWSPSRWMHENVGKNLVLGVASGIDENANIARASVGRLANVIKSASNGNVGAGAFSLTSGGAQASSAVAQAVALAGVVSQLSQLVNVTKDLPAQTGSEVSNQLKPVLAQQTTQQHMYAQQRGRQGAMGVNADGS